MSRRRRRAARRRRDRWRRSWGRRSSLVAARRWRRIAGPRSGGDGRGRRGARLGRSRRLRACARRRGRLRFPTTTGRIRNSGPSGGTTPATSRPPAGRHVGFQLTFFRPRWPRPIAALAARIRVGREPGLPRPLRGHRRGAAGASTRRAAEPRGARARGARGEPFRVWLEDWSAESDVAGGFPVRLRAADGDVAIDLVLERGKPRRASGRPRAGARKGPEPGNASYYYSLHAHARARDRARGRASRSTSPASPGWTASGARARWARTWPAGTGSRSSSTTGAS